MIDDLPEVQERNRSSGKLILPPYPGQQPSPAPHEQMTTADSGQFLPRNLSTPTNHFGKLWHLVRKDPAYRFLLVAVLLVFISSIVFVSFASSMFFAPAQSSLTTGPAGTTVSGTVDLRPTFAPPHGGQGSTTSSQPPKSATPSLANLPTAPPTQPTVPAGGALSVQIAGLPPQVFNNTNVQVFVMTNEPGASVRLIVQYNVAPGVFTSGTQTTDGAGTASLTWRIRLLGKRNVNTARVTAVAQDQNGQQAISQPVTVEVVSAGLGF